jgi:tetratricopeptide (TPR) repeat protein
MEGIATKVFLSALDIRVAVPRVVLLGFLLAALASSSAEAAPGTSKLSFRPTDPLNAVAFDHFYNLDYDRAIKDFEQVLQKHGDDPFAVNHLLTAVLFRELYRMGALNTGDYSNDSFVSTPHRPADPKAKEQIQNLVKRAFDLEEKALNAKADDVDALYARGVTRAQFATYTALIERAWFSALRNGVGARRDHERVLELSPNYTDAKLIVGAHNYVMGSLPWGVKVAVSMVRLNGSKEKGFEYLQQAANGSGESSIDAKILLALFYRREHRFEEALQIVHGLVPQFPQDVLLALEESNLLRAMGKNEEAAAGYRSIWQAGRAGKYPNLHYEVAAFGLGELLRSQKDFFGAATAYQQVNEAPQPDPEIQQKANLAAGEMYDVLQKRDLALGRYQAVLASNAESPQADMARKYIREAYKAD